MDICEKESKITSTKKRSDNLHKASSILSFAAILLSIALFVRMETVVHDTKMMDSKFTLQIQQIKDALKEQEVNYQPRVNEDFEIDSGKWRRNKNFINQCCCMDFPNIKATSCDTNNRIGMHSNITSNLHWENNIAFILPNIEEL